MKHKNERKASWGPTLRTTSGGYGVFRSRIDYTVSGYRRVLFFYIGQIYWPLYAYATVTSESAEASVAYGNTESEIGR